MLINKSRKPEDDASRVPAVKTKVRKAPTSDELSGELDSLIDQAEKEEAKEKQEQEEEERRFFRGCGCW